MIPEGTIFAQPITLYQRNSAGAFAPIFLLPLSQRCRLRATSTRKGAKVLSMANCGMRIAIDIGVICDHVSRLYRHFWSAGYDFRKRVYLESAGRDRIFRAAAKEDHEGWMILSADPPSSGVHLCRASATNLLKRSLIKSEVKT